MRPAHNLASMSSTDFLDTQPMAADADADLSHLPKEIQAKIERMRIGNPHKSTVFHGLRDLRTYKRPEVNAGLSTPNYPHHYTPEEYLKHLKESKYSPKNARTLMERHRESIKKALRMGEWIPPKVMSSACFQEVLDAAIMDLVADYQLHQRFQQQKRAQAEFLAAIGSGDAAETRMRLRKILVDACKQPGEAAGEGNMVWSPEGFRVVAVAGYPREIRVGWDDSPRISTLLCHDTAWGHGSLYGELFSIPSVAVESIYREALSQREVRLDDVRSIMGKCWEQYVPPDPEIGMDMYQPQRQRA